MDSPDFQQLLELETNLADFQSSLSTGSSTDLLFSHLEAISSNNHSSTATSPCTKQDVIDLLKAHDSFNLSLTCATCHQTLFENDEMATENKPKENLQDCCSRTLDRTYSNLEISFWCFLINSYTSCILTLPNYTRFMLQSSGIPPQLRDRVWGILTQSCDSNGTIDEYMQTLYSSLNTDISPDLRIIVKDVNRTFPELSMFNEYDTKVKFERLLNAYSIFDSDMGYCQGLQFIVAPFLFHYVKDKEEGELKTFNSIVNFFDINKLRNIYNNQMSDLHLWFYQFNEIFAKEIPNLHSRFEEMEVDLKLFLSQWILSFYSITIPFSFLIRLFDLMMFEGVKPTLLRAGLSILKKNQTLLNNIDDVELIYQHLLSENCWGVFSNDVDEFITSILEIPIASFTNEALTELEEQYEQLTASASASASDAESCNESLKNESVFNVFLNKLSFGLVPSTESTFSSAESIRPQSIFSSASNNDINESTRSDSIFSSTSGNSHSTITTANTEMTANHPPSSLSSKPHIPSSLSSVSKDALPLEDLELLQDLYKLCLENNLSSPVIDRARERLELEGL